MINPTENPQLDRWGWPSVPSWLFLFVHPYPLHGPLFLDFDHIGHAVTFGFSYCFLDLSPFKVLYNRFLFFFFFLSFLNTFLREAFPDQPADCAIQLYSPLMFCYLHLKALCVCVCVLIMCVYIYVYIYALVYYCICVLENITSLLASEAPVLAPAMVRTDRVSERLPISAASPRAVPNSLARIY